MSRFALDTRADRLRRHIAAVYDGVAGQNAQGRRIPGHLDIGILKDIFIPVETFGLLI